MKIAIASDHAGFPLKEEVRNYLAGLGHELLDLGRPLPSERVAKDERELAFHVRMVPAKGWRRSMVRHDRALHEASHRR